MRSLGILVVSLAGDDRADLTDREDKRSVERLFAHATIKILDEPVLCRLARRDVMPRDADVAGPRQHRVRGELGAVIGDDPGSSPASARHTQPLATSRRALPFLPADTSDLRCLASCRRPAA